jgi:hypothetical protein
MFRSILVGNAIIILCAAPARAQHGGGHAPPHTSPAPHGPSGSSSSHGTGHSSGTHTTSSTHGSSTHTGKTSTATKSTSTTTTTATGTTTLSPVQQKLQQNTQLASKLQSRLPAGTNLTTAASGFRNLGQFVAAVNVSKNLGIPFPQLKTQMVSNGLSLGQAIQKLRPSADSQTAVTTAEHEADTTIRSTQQASGHTSPKTKSKNRTTTPRTHGNG